MQNSKKLSEGIHLWDDIFSNNMLYDAKPFNHINGFYILKQHQHYVGNAIFASGTHKPTSRGPYFSQLDAVQQFVFYFKDKATDLLS